MEQQRTGTGGCCLVLVLRPGATLARQDPDPRGGTGHQPFQHFLSGALTT